MTFVASYMTVFEATSRGLGFEGTLKGLRSLQRYLKGLRSLRRYLKEASRAPSKASKGLKMDSFFGDGDGGLPCSQLLLPISMLVRVFSYSPGLGQRDLRRLLG